MKQITTLYLDSRIVKAIKQRGLSLSKIVNEVLKSFEGSLHEEEVRLVVLKQEREQLLAKHNIVKKELTLLQARLEELDEKIEVQKQIVEDVRKSEKIAGLLRELRELIVSENFDVEKAWEKSSSIRKSLEHYGYPMPKGKFMDLVERLKFIY